MLYLYTITADAAKNTFARLRVVCLYFFWFCCVLDATMAEANAPVGFERCLVVCGITVPAVRNALMLTQSCDSLANLLRLSEEDLDTTAVNVNKTRRAANQQPLVVNALHLKNLKAMRLWGVWQQRCSLPLNPDDFSEVQLRWGIERMEFEKRCKTSDGSDTPEPPKLTKIGFDIWQGFWRQFKNYCDTKRGAMKIPISYVFRDHLIPTAEMMAKEYADSDEALMMKVTLTGPDYHFDNKTVWGILTRLVGDGSAWPFIKSLQATYNGRRAIEILKSQSLSTASVSSRLARAFHVLKTTKYDGKDRKFSFNAYVEKLQFAFTELDECETPQTEGQKVDYLLTGFAASEKGQVRNRVINSPIEQDFGECCSHIAQYLAKTSIYNEPGGARRAVASVNQTKFTDAEWHALTPQEKEKVRALRKKEKAAAGNASSKKKTTTVQHKRKHVSAVSNKGTEKDVATSSDEDVPMKPPAKKKKQE